MMNLEQATALREKFYTGTSTLSDERQLLEFLRSRNCPPDWQADREVLEALVAVPEAEVPAGLEARIAARLSQQAVQSRRTLWRRLGITGIAATVAALFIGLYFGGRNRATVYADTCCTPQQAAFETHDVLFYVSEQLNMGVEAEDDLGAPCP